MTNQETPAFGKKALFIGGTGVISTAVCRRALACGWQVTVLNRGTNRARLPGAARVLSLPSARWGPAPSRTAWASE